MGKLLDFLWWWQVEPPDDGPHAAFALGVVAIAIFLAVVVLALEGIFNPYAARATRRAGAPPYAVMALYLALGGLIGAVSSLIVHKPMIAPTAARYASLLVAPLVVGIVTSAIAYWRGAPNAPPPRRAFWHGFVFALGIEMMRVAIH